MIDHSESTPVAFFTLADDGYMLGLVALVNSLRRTGHTEPIVVLDLGLSDANRALLAPECRLVDLPTTTPFSHPWLLKLAALTDFHGVAVLIDSDIIVASALHDLIQLATAGKVVAFAEPVHRFFPEWESMFELQARLRVDQPYVNSGCVIVHTDAHRDLVQRWRAALARLAEDGNRERLTPSDPSFLGDQDVLNALLMSELTLDELALQPAARQPLGKELARTKVVDLATLHCTLDGEQVRTLHSILNPKPWTPAARKGIPSNAYVTCLGPMLHGTALAVRVPATQIPPWLRPGTRAALERAAMHSRDTVCRGVAWARYQARRRMRSLKRTRGFQAMRREPR